MVSSQWILGFLLRWSEVIGGLGSLFPTAALVYLYRQQKDILDRTFRASNRAILEVDNSYLAGEKFAMHCSNVGNGVGLTPRLVIAGIYTDSSGEVHSGVIVNRLNRMDRGEPSNAGSIRPEEHEIHFEGRFSLPAIYGGQRTEFFTAVDELEREEIEVARVHTWIRYSDLTEQYRAQYIKGWEFELDISAEEVSEYLDQAAVMLFGEPDLNPETLELDLSGAATENERTVI